MQVDSRFDDCTVLFEHARFILDSPGRSSLVFLWHYSNFLLITVVPTGWLRSNMLRAKGRESTIQQSRVRLYEDTVVRRKSSKVEGK